MDDRPTWLPAPPPAAAPPPAPTAAAAPPAPTVEQATAETPAWVAPAPRSSRLWIYMTGLLLIIVIVVGGVWVRGQLLAGGNDQAVVAGSPTPLLSDYERADRFINTQLAPALAATLTPLQNIEKDCSPKTMTAPCKPDLIALNQAMIAGETTFDSADVPACVAREVNQFKYDWQGMEQGISLAISGYNDNSYDLYLQGLVKAGGIAKYLQPDMDRITGAEKTCSQATP